MSGSGDTTSFPVMTSTARWEDLDSGEILSYWPCLG